MQCLAGRELATPGLRYHNVLFRDVRAKNLKLQKFGLISGKCKESYQCVVSSSHFFTHQIKFSFTVYCFVLAITFTAEFYIIVGFKFLIRTTTERLQIFPKQFPN